MTTTAPPLSRPRMVTRLDVPVRRSTVPPDLYLLGSPRFPGTHRLRTLEHEPRCYWRVMELLYPSHDEFAKPARTHADELPCQCEVPRQYYVEFR